MRGGVRLGVLRWGLSALSACTALTAITAFIALTAASGMVGCARAPADTTPEGAVELFLRATDDA